MTEEKKENEQTDSEIALMCDVILLFVYFFITKLANRMPKEKKRDRE